jgi:fluoride ion exporter CrcB/FEX
MRHDDRDAKAWRPGPDRRGRCGRRDGRARSVRHRRRAAARCSDIANGDFLVNLVGCVFIGMVLVYSRAVWPPHRYTRLFLCTGVLDGITTFSASHWNPATSRGRTPPTAATYTLSSLAVGLVTVRAATVTTCRLPAPTGRVRMNLDGSAVRLTVYVGEDDRHHRHRLYPRSSTVPTQRGSPPRASSAASRSMAAPLTCTPPAA